MTLDLVKVIEALQQAVEESTTVARYREADLLALLEAFDDDEVLRRIEHAKTSWLLGGRSSGTSGGSQLPLYRRPDIRASRPTARSWRAIGTVRWRTR